MSLEPYRPRLLRESDLRLLEQHVTIPVTDLYDLLTRKDRAMPDLNNATTVGRAKRGYRTVKMTLKLNEWEFLSDLADAEDRTPDQQALHLLRQIIKEHQAARQAIQEVRGLAHTSEIVESREAREEWEEARAGN
jgi:hypothetical protein